MHEQIEKYFRGKLPEAERIELLKQVAADSVLAEEFSRYQNTQALLAFSDTLADTEESREGYRSFLSRIKRKKHYLGLKRTLGYAAAVALIVMTVHLYHIYTYTPDLPMLTDTSLFVPAGQRVSLTLQDGTVVWLNAQSRLTYPAVFLGQERRVRLEGEAYFEVAPDTEKPFIVSTGAIDMKVLGTAFNVYNYAGEDLSRVSLIEGSLQVYDPSGTSSGIILQPNQEVTIRDGQMTVAAIPNADYFLWKEGIYSFESEEFGVILKKLELYYDIEIVVKEPSMLRWEYTVKFRQRDGIDEIMRLMQKIHPFRLQKDEESNRIIIE